MIPLLLLIIICILCPPIAIGLAVIAGLVVAWYALIAIGGVGVMLAYSLWRGLVSFWKWLVAFVVYVVVPR